MKTTTRLEVLIFLAALPEKPAEQFNQGFALLQKTLGKSLTQERNLNKVGFNPTNLATVLYELKKLHKIKDSDVKNHQIGNLEVVHSAVDARSSAEKIADAIKSLGDSLRVKVLLLCKFALEFGSSIERKHVPEDISVVVDDWASALQPVLDEYPELAPPNEPFNLIALSESFAAEIEAIVYPQELHERLDEMRSAIADNNVKIEARGAVVKLFEGAGDDVKAAVKFRDQFPFLNDPELIPEFKILTADKFTAYHAFCDAHRELFTKLVPLPVDGQTLEECINLGEREIFELAKTAVENFKMDQLIWDELVNYRDKGEILGKHPVFKDRMLELKVAEMTIPEASKRKGNLENYIRRDGLKAESAKDEPTKLHYENKVLDWKAELVLVERKLTNAPK